MLMMPKKEFIAFVRMLRISDDVIKMDVERLYQSKKVSPSKKNENIKSKQSKNKNDPLTAAILEKISAEKSSNTSDVRKMIARWRVAKIRRELRK